MTDYRKLDDMTDADYRKLGDMSKQVMQILSDGNLTPHEALAVLSACIVDIYNKMVSQDPEHRYDKDFRNYMNKQFDFIMESINLPKMEK